MRCTRYWVVAVVQLSLAAGAAVADEEGSNTRERFICRSNTEVREIKTYSSAATAGDASGGLTCRVDYTKNGVTQTVWSSRTSRSYCDGKASKLAARLAAGNFSCKSLNALHAND